MAATETGDHDVDVISKSFLIYSVFDSRIQLSWSIVSGGITRKYAVKEYRDIRGAARLCSAA